MGVVFEVVVAVVMSAVVGVVVVVVVVVAGSKGVVMMVGPTHTTSAPEPIQRPTRGAFWVCPVFCPSLVILRQFH